MLWLVVRGCLRCLLLPFIKSPQLWCPTPVAGLPITIPVPVSAVSPVRGSSVLSPLRDSDWPVRDDYGVFVFVFPDDDDSFPVFSELTNNNNDGPQWT